jgi:hypothetical protein
MAPLGAITVPANLALAPKPAAAPTAQYTLQASAPPTRFTCAPAPTVSAAPIWKMNTAFGSPPASSVSTPPAVKFTAADAL